VPRSCGTFLWSRHDRRAVTARHRGWRRPHQRTASRRPAGRRSSGVRRARRGSPPIMTPPLG
jgi:hypothetical protein